MTEQPAESGTRCTAQYEPVPFSRRRETHTCARLAPHDGSHVCPDCQSLWLGTRVTSPEAGQR